MSNMDWEKFGNDIKQTVQDAIDSQDFRELNRTISNTVSETFGSVFDGVKSSIYTGPTTYVTTKPKKEEIIEVGVEKRYPKRKKSKYFQNITSIKASGILLAVFGFLLASIFLPFSLIALVGGTLFGGLVASATASIFGVLSAGSVIMGISGVKILSKVKRFQNYIALINGREYCDIKEIADSLSQSPKSIRRDLNRMIKKGWFKQGRIDKQGNCLMITEQAYEHYQNLLLQTEQQKLLEEAEEIRNNKENLHPEVQEIVRLGDAYIQKIKASNEAIQDREVSEKIFRMEILVDRIFNRIKEAPDQVPDVRRLMDYYLPTTIKLLDAYQELDQQVVKGPNILSSKKEIEQTLVTLNIAFEKMLDGMFQSKAMDVSSDISVLQTMLAQEGLTKKDFDVK